MWNQSDLNHRPFNPKADALPTSLLAATDKNVNVTYYNVFNVWWFNRTLSIYNRGRYSICNINQQLTNCQQILKIWCIHLFLFCNVMTKIVAFIVYFLSFNLANLNWPEESSTSIRYLCLQLTFAKNLSIKNCCFLFTFSINLKNVFWLNNFFTKTLWN